MFSPCFVIQYFALFWCGNNLDVEERERLRESLMLNFNCLPDVLL